MKAVIIGLRIMIAVALLPAGGARAGEDWFAKGIALMQEKRYEEAIRAFTLTVEIVPHDFQAYNNRGAAWFYLGEYAKAVADCTRAVELNPRYAKAFHNRGSAWFYQKNYDAAISDYSRAIELEPGYAEAYFNRGAAWLKTDRRKEALDDIRRAREIDPDHPAAARTLALLEEHRPPAETRPARPPAAPESASRRPPEAAAKRSPSPASPPASDPAAGRPDPLPTRMRWSIQMASFSSPEKATALAESMARSGYAMCTAPIIGGGNQRYYRVFAGRFADRQRAVTNRRNIRRLGYPDAFIVRQHYRLAVRAPDRRQVGARLAALGYVTRPAEIENGWLLVGAFRTRRVARIRQRELEKAGFECRVTRL